MHDFDWRNRAELKDHIRKFLLYPPFWNDTTTEFTLSLKWKNVKFEERNKTRVSNQKGIYCFVVVPKKKKFFHTKYLFYVGKTNRTLQERFGEYIKEMQSKRKSRIKVKEMFEKFSDHLYFYFAEIHSYKEVKNHEDKLINTFVPQVNVEVQRARIQPELLYIYE